MNRGWMRIQVYLLPVPITLLTAWLWLRWSGNGTFALHVTLLAIVYGYVVPGIGTNLLKKWRFTGPFRMGNYYIHHGFVWAANLSPVLLLCFLGTPQGALGWETITRVLLATGAVHAYKGWVYDLGLVRHGFAEVFNAPGLQGKSPEEVVAHYVPVAFFLIGSTYALGALRAYELFVVQGRTDLWAQAQAWAVGFLSMAIIPSLAYCWVEKRSERKARTQG